MGNSYLRQMSLSDEPYTLIRNRFDEPKVRIPDRLPIQISKVKDILPHDLTQKRAGVIVYKLIKDKIFMGLGIDSQHGSLTDFSGGIKSSDRDVIAGGLREFNEETLGIFGSIDPERVNNSIAVYSQDMMIIFLKVEGDIIRYSLEFKTKTKSHDLSGLEVKNIPWISKESFYEKIERGDVNQVYHRLYNFIRLARIHYGDFIYSLVYQEVDSNPG